MPKRCFVFAVKSYIRFGGVSPIAGEDKGFKHYKHFNTETCAHRCQNTNAQACKSFGVKTTGSNGTHGVDFHVSKLHSERLGTCSYSNGANVNLVYIFS